MSRKLAIHGRDHRQGGADPIPSTHATATCWRATGQGDPTFAVAPNAAVYIPWKHMETSDTSVFGTSDDGTTETNAFDDRYLLLKKNGVYVAHSACSWDGTTYYRYAIIANGSNGLPSGGQAHGVTGANSSSDSNYGLMDSDVIHVNLAPTSWGYTLLGVIQTDSVSHNVYAAHIKVVYWPSTILPIGVLS